MINSQILLIFGLLTAPTLVFSQAFEGVIKMQPSDPVMSAVSLSIRGERTLIEIGEGEDPIRILNDRPAGEVLVLVDDFHGEKWAVRIDPQELIAMAAEEEGSGPLRVDLDLLETGEVKTIDSYTCRKWTARTADLDIEAWITGDIPLHLPDLLPPGYETLIVEKNMRIAQQLSEKGFIMEYHARPRDGGTPYTFRMDVQWGALPPGRFEPSTHGYRTYDLMEAIQVAQEDPAKMQEIMSLLSSLSGG